MKNIINKEITPWKRPWNIEKFDDLYNYDERFFGILTKGFLSWLNRNIVLYNKGINHFVLNTGSTYMYIESNGYEYNMSETTGEDQIYMHLPRSIVELENISIPTEELSSPYSRGIYERRVNNDIVGFNADMRRIPIELHYNLHYVLSNYNEALILLQELIDTFLFQKYFNIIYLGKTIQCSIEFPTESQIEFEKIDMSSPVDNTKKINLSLTVCTSYPIIDIRSEIRVDQVISAFDYQVDLVKSSTDTITDTVVSTVD